MRGASELGITVGGGSTLFSPVVWRGVVVVRGVRVRGPLEGSVEGFAGYPQDRDQTPHTHAVKIAAFPTMTALARDIRLSTTYTRSGDNAHTLARQILTHTGDFHPDGNVLTIRLDPLPTARATQRLCEHLTATRTTYPGTNMIIRYEVKPQP